MPSEHDTAGQAEVIPALLDLSRQFFDEEMGRADIIHAAEILLQRLQSFEQRLDVVAVEQILKEIHGVAQLLQRDPKLVTLLWREVREVPTSLACPAPAALDELGRYVADCARKKHRKAAR